MVRSPNEGGSLYDRLRDNHGGGGRAEQLEGLRHRIHQRVIADLGPALASSDVEEEDLHPRVRQLLQEALRQEKTPLSAADRVQILEDVIDDILGHGPIERYIQDDAISEVMVNGPDQIWIERDGKLERTGATFIDETHLRRVIERIVARVGRRIDESSPMVDARLPDGSRVNAIYPPLSIGGPYLTIRKFAADPYTTEDLIDMRTVTPVVAEFLEACVRGRMNIVVSGATSTGKTTLLNVLSSYIPSDERIVTIEDAKELQLRQDHVLCLEARPPNTEGKGEVTIRDLVRNTLRMRPDRIIVGECRAGEALDMLQAMNTGHDGSLTTIHANSPRDALARVETMTLMAGFDLPVKAIREQMASALDMVVHLGRMRDGTRHVTHVTEVERMEGDIVVLQDIFLFDFGMGVDPQGHYRGELKATGLRPQFAEALADRGIHLPTGMFESSGFVRAPVGRR
ncbi:MAG TPA: CpaF family protein [Acidimicrobiales bacterium]|nr:CpaF family protein [Acidimicrobiales bacterium]